MFGEIGNRDVEVLRVSQHGETGKETVMLVKYSGMLIICLTVYELLFQCS